jgi:hypothetical protein
MRILNLRFGVRRILAVKCGCGFASGASWQDQINNIAPEGLVMKISDLQSLPVDAATDADSVVGKLEKKGNTFVLSFSADAPVREKTNDKGRKSHFVVVKYDGIPPFRGGAACFFVA